MESCSLSNPKRDVCECSGNNIKLSECQRDISKPTDLVSTVMKSATKWILFFTVQVNKCNISRANFSFSCHDWLIITEFVIAFSQSKKQSFLGGACVQFYTQASVQLHFLCFCFHSVFLFSFFFVFVLAFFTIAIVKQPHYKRNLNGTFAQNMVLRPTSSSAVTMATIHLPIQIWLFLYIP